MKFTNLQGQTLDVNSPDNSMPTEAELDQMFAIRYGNPSIGNQGINYIAQHPFRSISQPLAQTLTGKSFQKRGIDYVKNRPLPAVPNERPLNADRYINEVKNKTFKDVAVMGMLGSTADIATTPASYVPIPGLNQLGKIPVGSTNVGRIASNIAVKNPLTSTGREAIGKSVQELQRMESALQQSGRLSSRGIYPQAYKENIENQIFKYFISAINPNLRKFKGTKGLQQYKNDVVETVKTINDYSSALQLKNPETEQISNLPTQGRNIIDFIRHKNDPNNKILFAQALEQTKKNIWKSTSAMSRDAGGQGVTVNIPEIINPMLNNFINSPKANTYLKSLVRKAVSLKESYKSRTAVSPDEIEDDLKFINQEIGKHWNGRDVNAVNFYSSISKKLRETVDDSIENTLSRGGWQDGRNKYRALKNVENDIMRSAAKTALKGDATMGDKLLDTFAGEELVRSLWRLDPKILTNSAAIKSYQILRGHLSSPDRRISEMFNLIKKSSTGPLINNKPINFNQIERPFPFPNGPASVRSPIQAQRLLPFNRPLGLPSPRNVPYHPTGQRGGEISIILPYQSSGKTIQMPEIPKSVQDLMHREALKNELEMFKKSSYRSQIEKTGGEARQKKIEEEIRKIDHKELIRALNRAIKNKKNLQKRLFHINKGTNTQTNKLQQ